MNNKRNKKKTPVVFYVSLVLLCLCMVTMHMTGGLYARYSTAGTGSSGVQVAKISYKFDPDLTNTPLFVSSHPLDTNEVPASCNLVAFEETFSLTNDGDVAYSYNLTLTLTDSLNRELPDHKLTSISDSAWVAKTKAITIFETGNFYYYVGDSVSLNDAASPTLSGTLAIGEQVQYRILYFVNIDTAEFNQDILLKYSITCTQID